METKKMDRTTSERELMNRIRIAIAHLAITFRVNVVTGLTKDGRYITSGVPPGYSDISGHRKKDGRAIYLEVKTKTGRATPEQLNFLKQMQATGAIAGIVRSVEDAIALLAEPP